MSKKCIICGTETREFEHKVFGMYHCCSRCDFISKDDEDIITSEAELDIYNTHNNSIDDPRYVEYFKRFLDDAVFGFVEEDVQALDFGSGPSPVLAQILQRHYGYHVDIYDKFFAPDKVYVGKQYDLITSTEVVEHLADPIPYFELFAGLLKEKGVLAVMTQFHKKDDAFFKNWHYIRDRSHCSFYTPKTFEYISKQTGLKIIHTDNIKNITFIRDK